MWLKRTCSLPAADPGRSPQYTGTPKQRGTSGPRRRNGRWSEQETQTLIELVRRNGKGKWKKILEDGREIFVNRTQARASTFAWRPAVDDSQLPACLQWHAIAATPYCMATSVACMFAPGLPDLSKFNWVSCAVHCSGSPLNAWMLWKRPERLDGSDVGGPLEAS